MKLYRFIPLLFLTACSPTPKLVLRPRISPPITDGVRYPEVIHAYYFGRYVDPNDDLVMHGQQVVYRVEENSRWNLHPAATPLLSNVPVSTTTQVPPHNAAFSPLPINDAELAEMNAQKLATFQIMGEARRLTSAMEKFQQAWQQTKTNLQETVVLRAAITKIQKRLDTLALAQKQTRPSVISTTNDTTLSQP